MSVERRRFTEVLIILALMLVSVLFIPELTGLMALLPIVYFFVERRIRDKNAATLGALVSRIGEDVGKSWVWILLVAVVSQVVFVFLFKTFSPEIIAHVQDRLPSNGMLNTALIIAILIGPLGEEISYRGLFQERFGWVMPSWAAIVITSLLFALMHFNPGPADVVFWDLFSVFVDSVLFGIIYAKTRNILVSYIAHLLADIVGLILLFIVV